MNNQTTEEKAQFLIDNYENYEKSNLGREVFKDKTKVLIRFLVVTTFKDSDLNKVKIGNSDEVQEVVSIISNSLQLEKSEYVLQDCRIGADGAYLIMQALIVDIYNI